MDVLTSKDIENELQELEVNIENSQSIIESAANNIIKDAVRKDYQNYQSEINVLTHLKKEMKFEEDTITREGLNDVLWEFIELMTANADLMVDARTSSEE